jgi:endonuclease YncB( thermonuclease family)
VKTAAAFLLALIGLSAGTGPVAAAASSPAKTPPSAPAPTSPTLPAKGEAPRLPLPDLSKFTAHRVLKIDGLSVSVSTGNTIETVSLLGVEPPRPSDPATPAASAFLSNLLTGESVYLVDHESGRKVDEKKSRIVYLHRAPDGLLVNAELIRQGYAREQADTPYQYQDALRGYEGLARAARKGLWADPAKAIKPGTDPSKPDAKPDAKPETKPGEASPTGVNPTPAETDAKPMVPVTAAPTPGAQPAGGNPGDKAAKPARAGVTTVYASKSGNRYHTETCRYLGKTKDPITVEEAKKRNLTPCGECKPGV